MIPIHTQPSEYLLALYLDLPQEAKSDLSERCRTEYLPALKGLQGVLNATQFEAVEGSPNTLILNELELLQAPGSREYLAASKAAAAKLGARLGVQAHDKDLIAYRLRISRATTEATLSEAPFLVATRLFVKDGHEAETRAWLDEEHSQRQLTVPGTLAYFGYESLEQPFHFLNIWALRAPEVQASAEWAEASKTPRREHVMQGREKLLRGVFKRA